MDHQKNLFVCRQIVKNKRKHFQIIIMDFWTYDPPSLEEDGTAPHTYAG